MLLSTHPNKKSQKRLQIGISSLNNSITPQTLPLRRSDWLLRNEADGLNDLNIILVSIGCMVSLIILRGQSKGQQLSCPFCFRFLIQ